MPETPSSAAWEIGGIVNARSGVPVEVLVVRPDIVVQCTQAGGCPNGAGGTFAQGFVANLPSFGTTFPALPTGFVAVVNTPGGGNSRNIRRPNLVAGVNPYLGNDRNFINPAAFATPAPGQWGDFPRNELSGPTFRQFDMILAKRWRFKESMNVEFRTEFFNIFNQTNFAESVDDAQQRTAEPELQHDDRRLFGHNVERRAAGTGVHAVVRRVRPRPASLDGRPHGRPRLEPADPICVQVQLLGQIRTRGHGRLLAASFLLSLLRLNYFLLLSAAFAVRFAFGAAAFTLVLAKVTLTGAESYSKTISPPRRVPCSTDVVRRTPRSTLTLPPATSFHAAGITTIWFLAES